jgi:polygalacturonase
MKNKSTIMLALLCIIIWGINLNAQSNLSNGYNILRFGAKCDGKTVNTEFIQKAIDECNANGGGVVTVPTGKFITGMILLKDNVTLNLEKGSTLEASIDTNDFAADLWHKCVIAIKGVSNVSLIGEGTVDGRGDKFTVKCEAPNRPYVVLVQNSKNIRIKDVTLKNSARWTLRLLKDEHVFVSGVTIYSQTNYNNDGIDIDGKDIVISDCIINCDDDAICFKSDSTNAICENVVVTNCVLRSNRNFVKFGTASFGGFRNITVSNITMEKAFESNLTYWDKRILGVDDPITGITGIVLEVVDGGIMDRITISNITMDGVQSPIFIRLGIRKPVVGQLKNVLISNVVAKTYSQMPSIITAVPGSYIENITLRDIIVYAKGGGNMEMATRDVIENEKGYPENRMFGDNLPGYGLYVRHAKNIVMDNVQFFLQQSDYRSAIYFDDAHDIRIRNLKADKPEGSQPVIYDKKSSGIDTDKNYN